MKLFAALLAFSALLFPASAGVKNPETLVFVESDDIDSLDPAWAYDQSSHMAQMNIYETLIFPDGPSVSRFIPLLAESVPSVENGGISRDGLTYRFRIRKGVKFHDGSVLSAEDVRYSLLRYMLIDHEFGPSRTLLEPILGLRSTRDPDGRIIEDVYERASRAIRVEGQDVVIALARPFAPFLASMAQYGRIVSKKWAIAKGDWDGSAATWKRFNNPKREDLPFYGAANGTGPFKLARWDRLAKELVLERHDGYWRGPARLKRVMLKAVDEMATRKMMLSAADADVITADRVSLPLLAEIPGVVVIDNLPSLDLNPIVYFTFRIKEEGNRFIGSGKLDGEGIPPDFFSDKDVRKAFAYAFDYEGFLREAYRGRAHRARGAIPTSLLALRAGEKLLRLDPAESELHFKKAWGGKVWEKGFKLTVVYNKNNTARLAACQIFKKNIERLNPRFKIDVQLLDWPAYLDGMKNRKLPVYLVGMGASYADPHAFAAQIHSDPDYPGEYKNEEADALVDRALLELDPQKRADMYYRLLEIEREDVPKIELIEPVAFIVQGSWVRDRYHNPLLANDGYFYPVYKERQ